MARKPTYEELKQRVKELEKEAPEHRRTEEELRKSKDYLDRILKGMNEGVVVIDRNFAIKDANDCFIEQYNTTREDIIGRTCHEVTHQSDKPCTDTTHPCPLKEVFNTHKPMRTEHVHTDSGGKGLTVEICALPLFGEDGNVELMVEVAHGITEKVQAEKALRESEERYRTLFENATDAIFIADTNTNIILDANRQAERLIGRPREEIIGMHQAQLHPPDQAEYYKDKFRRHVQKGRFLDLEAEVIKKDGSIVPVFINASVINLHGKKIIQGLFKDITEEKVILDLRKEMAVRRLIEKAKGMLMDRHNISEKEAMRQLQKESRRQRKKIEEIAKDVISSELFLK